MTDKKQKVEEEKIRYKGYFLMDSGLKISFDISEADGGEAFTSMYESLEFSFEKGDIIWLGEDSDLKILVDRIIGWDIKEYEQEV